MEVLSLLDIVSVVEFLPFVLDNPNRTIKDFIIKSSKQKIVKSLSWKIRKLLTKYGDTSDYNADSRYLPLTLYKAL